MIRQPSHLCEIAHGGLTAIVLPVGIRRERSRGVESQVRSDACEFLGIQRQDLLHSFNQIQHQHGNATEQQHGEGVFRPPHFMLFVHQGQAIQQALQPPQHGIEKRLLPVEHPRHEYPHRLGHSQYRGEVDDDLQPTIRCHF